MSLASIRLSAQADGFFLRSALRFAEDGRRLHFDSECFCFEGMCGIHGEVYSPEVSVCNALIGLWLSYIFPIMSSNL